MTTYSTSAISAHQGQMKFPLIGEKPRRPDSFSLVEVAFSLAIVSFGCLTILGLIPAGLSSFQTAMKNTVESEIVQTTMTDISLTAFTNLASVASPNQTYFNADGIKTNAAAAMYSATIKFTDLSSYNANSTSPLAGISSWSGTTAVIRVIKLNQNHTNYYSTVVGNNQASTNNASAATW